MAKLGSKKRPAVVTVSSEEEARAIVSLCSERGWEVIAGVEPNAPEDISDLEKLLASDAKPQSRTPRLPPKISGNDYCPCGSGKKFKKCRGAT